MEGTLLELDNEHLWTLNVTRDSCYVTREFRKQFIQKASTTHRKADLTVPVH